MEGRVDSLEKRMASVQEEIQKLCESISSMDDLKAKLKQLLHQKRQLSPPYPSTTAIPHHDNIHHATPPSFTISTPQPIYNKTPTLADLKDKLEKWIKSTPSTPPGSSTSTNPLVLPANSSMNTPPEAGHDECSPVDEVSDDSFTLSTTAPSVVEATAVPSSHSPTPTLELSKSIDFDQVRELSFVEKSINCPNAPPATKVFLPYVVGHDSAGWSYWTKQHSGLPAFQRLLRSPPSSLNTMVELTLPEPPDPPDPLPIHRLPDIYCIMQLTPHIEDDTSNTIDFSNIRVIVSFTGKLIHVFNYLALLDTQDVQDVNYRGHREFYLSHFFAYGVRGLDNISSGMTRRLVPVAIHQLVAAAQKHWSSELFVVNTKGMNTIIDFHSQLLNKLLSEFGQVMVPVCEVVFHYTKQSQERAVIKRVATSRREHGFARAPTVSLHTRMASISSLVHILSRSSHSLATSTLNFSEAEARKLSISFNFKLLISSLEDKAVIKGGVMLGTKYIGGRLGKIGKRVLGLQLVICWGPHGTTSGVE